MRHLSGADAAFFCLERPGAPMESHAVVVLDPGTDSELGFADIEATFAARLHRLPALRQRLRRVPFDLDHPFLEDCPDFLLDDHLHHVALPMPGDAVALSRFVSQVASRTLDPGRPLWEAWFAEGMPGGRKALVMKVHHALMDGVSGAAALSVFLDTEAAPPKLPAPPPWEPEAACSDLSLLGNAVWRSSVLPSFTELPELTGTFARALRYIGAAVGGDAGTDPARPFVAPDSQLGGPATPRRRVALLEASLDELREIRTGFGTTINDVVLAATSRALRHYFIAHDMIPEGPLVAAVPIAIRDDDEMHEINNRVSVLFVRLPVQIASIERQLEMIHEETRQAKELHRALGPRSLLEISQHLPPAVLRGGVEAYSLLTEGGTHHPLANLIVSNVPGPQIPFFMAGARVSGLFPLGPVLDGLSINLTVMGIGDRLNLGVITCRDVLADPATLAEGFASGIAALRRKIPQARAAKGAAAHGAASP